MPGQYAMTDENGWHNHARAEPDYGRRLLPQVLDELAESDPGRIFASVPLSSDISQGFYEVTVRDVARATDYVAWWLDEQIGRSTTFETVAYIGISDLRYATVFLAAVKCGYKMLLPSVRNSAPMNVSLLEQTECLTFLFPQEMSSNIAELQVKRPGLRYLMVPSFDVMVRGTTQYFPFKKTFESARWDPILILCSSGSTGPPKPIVTCHGTYSVYDNDRNLPTINGRKNQNSHLFNFDGGGRYFSAFPPFHLAGFLSGVILPIFSTTATLVLGPADRPPNGMLVSQIIRHYKLRALFVPPVIAEQLLQVPEGIDQAKSLDFLLYAGGPLNPSAGEPLSQVTDLCQFYGSTETGPVQAFVPLRENWAYLELHPLYEADMQPADDDAYEMVLHSDPKFQSIRSLAHTFPDVDVWRTKDLFRPHPTNNNLWKFHGRTDDIIVLSNGEKFNPIPLETIIQGHPLLKGALILGQGLFQPALLVEPKEPCQNEDALIEEIWPTVERANSISPGHARITKFAIIVATPDKPFRRAAKGTVVRKLTAEDYLLATKALFSIEELTGLDSVKQLVRSSVESFFPQRHVAEDDDFYVLGLDSLKTVELAGKLRATLPTISPSSTFTWCTSQLIYTHPRMSKLSKAIFEYLNTMHTAPTALNDDLVEARVLKMASLFERYTIDLPYVPLKPHSSLWASDIYTVLAAAWSASCPVVIKPRRSLKIILTGTTGSLGSRLLQRLMEDATVSKVYCLNRSSKAKREKQKAAEVCNFKRDGPGIQYFTVDYDDTLLGRSPAEYAELLNVDIIIHNGWKVDFNHNLDSFEKQLQGVRNIINLSTKSWRRPHLFFVSSISTAGNWALVYPNNRSVPELPLDNYYLANSFGYAESKHVAERILDVAHSRSSVPVSILRVGQIAGPLDPQEAMWNKHEWLPALIQTSKAMKLIPERLPDMDWIPVDALATVTVEIMHYALDKKKTQCYNLINPKQAPWSDVLPLLVQRLGPQCQVVPLAMWIEALKGFEADDETVRAEKPALKILSFYEQIAKGEGAAGLRYDTANGMAASRTLSNLPAVNIEWMEMWLDQWGV